MLALARASASNEWESIVPQLDAAELRVLVSLLPEGELTELLSEIEPIEAARILADVLTSRKRPICSKRWRPTMPPMSSTSCHTIRRKRF